MFTTNSSLLTPNFSKRASRAAAFTLAEVLITLGIIGVVAAMSIPVLLQNAQDREAVSKVKKIYSTLSQAFMSAVQENGTPDGWDLVATGDGGGAVNVLSKLAPYLKIVKNCGNGTGCIAPDVYYKNFINIASATAADASTTVAKAVLADGILFTVYIENPSCNLNQGSGVLNNTCATFYVDINGSKGPNKKGSDFFAFYLTKSAIVPRGVVNETSMPFSTYCSRTGTYKDNNNNGSSCTAWVLYNENMDYLHCDGLSWSGAHTCN